MMYVIKYSRKCEKWLVGVVSKVPLNSKLEYTDDFELAQDICDMRNSGAKVDTSWMKKTIIY